MHAAIAALPMYDWPEERAGTDAEWTRLSTLLRAAGVDAPDRLARSNADLPAVPGGIMDEAGSRIAPDPATLPPGEFDLHTLWRHPRLLLAQTCWGPLDTGLAAHVRVLAQPGYDGIEGGSGPFYSSAILMRRTDTRGPRMPAPAGGQAIIPLDAIEGKRFAFNNPDSMSGLLGISRDLADIGRGLDIFAETIETGAHRASIAAVAEGRADVCAIDCRSWMFGRRHDPRSAELQEVGWTAWRKGLPYVTSRHTPEHVALAMRRALGGG